jgi:hypothetical protein
MNTCLSGFGFIGTVDQELQSLKDVMTIGRFTTMTMIRNILILTIIAALVPTAMSNVSASADAEIALFSRASVDINSLTISGNGDSAEMELKAINDNGKSNRVSGFQLTADNVLSTEVGDKVTVKDNVDFTKAVITDAMSSQKAIGITSNGVIDLAGYTQGVYTLDIVVDDDRAYEAIIAIGDQTNQIVDKEITRVNSEYTTKIEFVYPSIEDPNCSDSEKLVDGKCEPIGYPYCDLVSDGYKGTCHDRQDYDDSTGLASCRDGSKVVDYKDCKDAGKHPDEQLYEMVCPAHAGGCEDINEDDAMFFPDNSIEFPTEEIDCDLQPELCEENIVEISEEEVLPEEDIQDDKGEDGEEGSEADDNSDDSEGDEVSGSDDNEVSEGSDASENQDSGGTSE